MSKRSSKRAKGAGRRKAEGAQRVRSPRAREQRQKAPGLGSLGLDEMRALFAEVQVVKDGRMLPHRRPNYARDVKTRAEQQAAFLATLKWTGNVRASHEAAGVSRASVYEWREQDETFKALWKAALDEAIDLLEEEAWRRGYHGVDKPIVYKGKVMSTYKEYSDRMLEILLKAHRKKFRDKTEITGEDGGPISVVTKVERIIVKPPKREE